MRIYENANAKPQIQDYSTADLLIDSDSDDLPARRLAEREVFHIAAMTQSKSKNKKQKPCESEETVRQQKEDTTTDQCNLTVATSMTDSQPEPFKWQPGKATQTSRNYAERHTQRTNYLGK